jgi:hypothetical protein
LIYLLYFTVKSGYLNEKYQSNKDDVDNYLLRQSDRMAQRSYSVNIRFLIFIFHYVLISEKRVEPPEEIGYFNIYFREPNSYGHRRALRRVRFPVARYSRRRFRMYRLNLSSFSNIKSFIIALVGPFMNFQLSMPIFVDPSTGQTIIHSSRRTSKSIYILKNLSQ